MSVALAVGCGGSIDDHGDGTSAADLRATLSAGELALTAGTCGTVWTLDKYPDGRTHPGRNSTDISHPSCDEVFLQYRFGNTPVAGGTTHLSLVSDNNLCSDRRLKGTDHFNGDKVRVLTHFWSATGRYLGSHESAFQHVIDHGLQDGKERVIFWNAARSTGSFWPWATVKFDNGGSGGYLIGHLFHVPPGKVILNPVDGKICTDGTHLHEQGNGRRNPSMVARVTKVEARMDDVILFVPNASP